VVFRFPVSTNILCMIKFEIVRIESIVYLWNLGIYVYLMNGINRDLRIHAFSRRAGLVFNTVDECMLFFVFLFSGVVINFY